MSSADEIATWLTRMRQGLGLSDPRNPLRAAPEVVRNVVGAVDAPPKELRQGLEFFISQFMCGPNGDESTLDSPDRLLLGLSMNQWPCDIPEPLKGSPSITELQWMERGKRLAASGLVAGCTEHKQANNLSDHALRAFALFLLEHRDAPRKNYFSRALRDLHFSDGRQIQLHEVGKHVPGTPAISWADFSKGIERLSDQIKQHGADFDLSVGVNEAGLAMAALLAPARNTRPILGLIRTKGMGDGLHRIQERFSFLPPAAEAAEDVLLCDFEAKTGNAVAVATSFLREEVPGLQRIYFAVMGALAADGAELFPTNEPLAFEDLACSSGIYEAGVDAVFAASLIVGGIDPPNRSR